LLAFVKSVSPNSKVFQEEFLLFVFVTGDNTQTDLQIRLLPSGMSSIHFFSGADFVGVHLLILPCIYSWTNEYSD